MKKILLTLFMAAASLSMQAYDYPYLTFTTSDGTATAMSVESLTITVSNGQLVVKNSDGSKTFTLTDLSKMYFTADATSIKSLDSSDSANSSAVEVYDLQGRKVSRDRLRRGTYVVKSKNGTRKVTVK